MIPYFLLLAIPFLMYFICVGRKENGARVLLIGVGGESERSGFLLPTFFLFLFGMLVCRSIEVGRDLDNYHYIFNYYAGGDWTRIFSGYAEVLFAALNYGVRSLTDNYQVFLATVAVLEILPLALVYCRDRSHPFLKVALFVNMSTFSLLFSGIRQSIAISLGVLAFECLNRRQTGRFLLIAAVAALTHWSGFMIALLYPLYHLRLKRKYLWFVGGVTAVLVLLNDRIFGFLTWFMAHFYDNADLSMEATGAWTMVILFAMLTAFCYVISDERRMDREAFALRNILVFALWLQCFAPVHTLAMRMNYYFIVFIPLAVGACLKTPRRGSEKLALLGEAVLVIFFVIYFCVGIYSSYVSGQSSLDTVPYIPFWAD